MRKFIGTCFIIVILAAIFFLISPVFIGMSIQKNYQKQLQTFNENPQVQFSLVGFQRGWFKSTAQVRMTVTDTDSKDQHGQPKSYSIDLNQTVYNGFVVPYRDAKGSHLTFGYASILMDKTGEKDSNIGVSAIWKFGNQFRFYAYGKDFQHTIDGIHLQVSDLNGWLEYRNNRVEGNISLGMVKGIPTTSSSSSRELTITNVTLSVDADKINNLWFGTNKFSIGSLAANDGGSAIKLNDLSFITTQEHTKNKVNSSLKIMMNSFVGPDMKLSDLDFLLYLKDVDMNAMDTFISKAQQIKTPTDAMGLIPSALNVINKGAVVQLDTFSVNTQYGPIKMSGTIILPAGDNGSLKDLLKNVTANASASVPKTILTSLLTDAYSSQKIHHHYQMMGINVTPAQLAQEAITQWTSNRMLIANGDNVEMKFQFKKGVATVNGLPPKFDLPKLSNSTTSNNSSTDSGHTDTQNGQTDTNTDSKTMHQDNTPSNGSHNNGMVQP